MERDLDGVIDFARNLDPGELQNHFHQRIVNRLSRENLERALSWAENIDPESPARQQSMRTVITHWANENPNRAARYVRDLDDPNLSRILAGNVAQIWGQDNPTDAAHCAEELPSDQGGREATIAVARSWLRHDPYNASEWIDQISNQKTRDAAVQQLVQTIQQEDPEAAFLWAESISDPNVRMNLLEYSLRQWSKRDPDAAEGSVWDISLTQDERTRLLARVGRHSTIIK